MAKAATKKAAATKKGGKRSNRKPKRSFKTYIKRVLAQGKTKVGLSGKAAAIVNSFVFDQFDRIATQAASAVAITGGSVTGITDLAVADGGTGASTAAAARTNLGLGTWATKAQTVSTATPSGTPADGDVWLTYTP